MKSISLFIISVVIVTVCSAQSDPSVNGTSGMENTNTYQQENNTTNPDQNSSRDPNQNVTPDHNQNYETGNTGSRSDYYEVRKEPENVRYYSGGHRGTNIINDDNSRDRYRQEEARNRSGENQFPDLIRFYSGSHYGNNIINKEAVNRAKGYYYGDPSSTYPGQQDNYQPK